MVAIHYLTALKATQIINPQETNEPSIPKNKGTPIISKKQRFLFQERLCGEQFMFKKKVVAI